MIIFGCVIEVATFWGLIYTHWHVCNWDKSMWLLYREVATIQRLGIGKFHCISNAHAFVNYYIIGWTVSIGETTI